MSLLSAVWLTVRQVKVRVMEFAKDGSSVGAQQVHELRDDVEEDIVEEGALEFEEGQFGM